MSSRESKILVIIFPGKGLSLKSYVSYFPTLDLKTQKQVLKPVGENKYYLCHSLGAVDFLKTCESWEFQRIIFMDPPDLSDFENQILKIKDKLVVFRKSLNQDYSDNKLYKNLVFYPENTHYPYQVKKLRNKICSFIEES